MASPLPLPSPLHCLSYKQPSHKIYLQLCFEVKSQDPLGDFCNKDSTKISTGTQISQNIDSLLAELLSCILFLFNTASTGFLATAYGENQDQVYGLAQCRGDVVGTKDCSSCIQDAAKQIRQRCPNQADARIWYDYCFLRYSDKSFIGEVDTSYGIFYYNVDNVTDPEKFNEELGALTDKIRAQAVMPESGGLGKGETKLSPFVTLYALVQCTRDLSKLGCSHGALAIAVGNFPTFCNNRKGCRVLYSSCYVRYELYPFFYPLDSNNTLHAVDDNNVMAIAYP
ncbi:unnamed protein product [Malus baccata var. baccata]